MDNNKREALEKAFEEYGKALKLNPNDWMAYSGKGELNSNYNPIESINNYNKAISLNRGEQLSGLLRSLGYVYMHAGFMEKFKYYSQEAFKLDQDTAAYYTYLYAIESFSDNKEKAYENFSSLFI